MTLSPRPTRLAFVITDLDVGGAERALVEIVTRLDRLRWEPAVFCLGPRGELVDALDAAGVSVTCHGARSARNLLVLPRLTRALRTWQPALLQSFLFHANVLSRIAGRRAGGPVIVSGVRVADRRAAWRHWVDRRTAAWADHHVCVSEAVADFAVEHARIPRERITVIPNGVDHARFASAEPADLREFGIPAGSRVLLFVGRLDPQKDPLAVLEAFVATAATRPDVRLLLVGDGPLRSTIESRRAASPVGDRVHLVGRRGDVPELMRAAELLVLPSRFEGMPIVVLEAMAAGLPVVASDVEGVGEIVRHEQTGLLVPPESPRALREAIERYLDAPQFAGECSKRAQEISSTTLAIDSRVREYEQLYARLLGIDTRFESSNAV